MSAAIEIEQVSKRFGSLQALDKVTLRIEQGEFFALLGPNGAGKTTLISTLAGLVRADSGSARIMGFDVVGDYRQSRRSLGVVPQELVQRQDNKFRQLYFIFLPALGIALFSWIYIKRRHNGNV